MVHDDECHCCQDLKRAVLFTFYGGISRLIAGELTRKEEWSVHATITLANQHQTIYSTLLSIFKLLALPILS